MVAIRVLALAALSTTKPAIVSRQGTTCSATPACPSENNCTTTSTNGGQFQMQCGTNLNSGVLSTTRGDAFTDCANACGYYGGCTGFNFQGQFCYLVGNSTGTAVPATNVTAGVMITAPISNTTISGACGATVDCSSRSTSSQCTFSDNNKNFVVACNMDFYGGDQTFVRAANMTSCIQQCGTTVGCQAVSWSSENYWLKNATNTGNFNTRVSGAYVQ